MTTRKSNSTLGTPNSATLTIINNNLINGAFSFFPTNYSVSESGLVANLTVVRSFGATGVVSVSYRTVPGTALAGSDFVAVTNTLAWANGDASPKSFAVTLVDDAIVESSETFGVELFGATGGSVVGAVRNWVRMVREWHAIERFPWLSACMPILCGGPEMRR